MDLIVGVVGGRDFDDYELMKMTLDRYSISCIVSGKAKGADRLAARYANERDLELIEFNPQWDKYGRAAGAIRNRKIAEVVHELVAFWDGKSPGTKITINFVKELKKPVHIINYGNN